MAAGRRGNGASKPGARSTTGAAPRTPTQTQPSKTQPAEATPATPAKAEGAKAKPATPAKAKPEKAKPAKAKPATPAKAKAAKAKPATPAKAKPAKTKPAKAKPATPAKAKPEKAKPTSAQPAGPKAALAKTDLLGANFEAVMAELRRLGKPNTAKIYARHGVKESSVGLAYADLKKLIKQLGTQHELALELWRTGVHDARVLATKIVDPARVSAQELERWIADSSNYIVTAAVAGVAARVEDAVSRAKHWIESAEEWRSSAGWSVLTDAALSGKLDDPTAKQLLETIRARIHQAANRTRYSMNNTLIAIGGANPRLRSLALEIAERIGPVEVDHGQTGCKTPDAASYIRKMVAHAAPSANAPRRQT